MQCSECLSHNDSGAAFCTQCGAKIGIYPSGGPKVLTILAGLLLVSVLTGGAVAFFMSQRGEPADSGSAAADPGTGSDSAADVADRDPANPKQAAAPADLDRGASLRLAVRRLSFVGHGGHQLGATEVIVSGDGWVPIARRQALAAVEWVVTGQASGRSAVVNGVWRRGEKLGLWRVRGNAGQGAALGRYEEGEPLELHPLTGGEVVTLSSPRAFRDGSFMFFATEEPAGALVQRGVLVGWILADPPVAGGWLWPGEVGDAIRPELSVDDFYDMTFAGGREEGFAEALPTKQVNARVQAIIDAQRLRPKLLDEETPSHLRIEQVLPIVVRDLISIRDRGDPTRVASLLSSEVVGDFRDTNLLLLAVDTWDDAFGEEAAIGLANQWWADLIVAGSEAESQLTALVVSYYGRWLTRLIRDQAIDVAWTVYQEATHGYPDDAEIHLSGVELHLYDNNWADAERSLDARVYPARFSDKVALLRRRIQELKSLEGRIIVRFRPGARQIRTQAQINGSVSQDFIIDTGASVTTLPSATARQLGIRITDSTPRVRVRTAGGDVMAADITLDSVAIGGWEIRDVRVLVHDLPGNEAIGLLGINFLGKFRMDLRTDEGMLILEPR